MQSKDLLEIVIRLRQQGTDDERVEVKKTTKSIGSSVWESVSAFGNTHGGLIILGLDEENGFTVDKDFDIEKIRDQFVSGIGDGGADNAVIENPPQYEMNRIPFEEGQVLAIEISEVDPRFKPCFIKKRGPHNGAYKRIDDKDVKLSPTEVFELQNVLYPSTADRSAVPEASIDDLDETIVTTLIEREIKRGAKSLLGVTNKKDQMTRLNLTDKNGKVRLAGLLAAGFYPQQYYPKTVVDITVHPGIEKSLPGERRFEDRVICEGNLGEVIADAVQAIMRNLRTYSIIRGTGRTDVPEIPEEVLREAIANAVLHREYSPCFIGQAVSVDIYSDRIVITNPGGLWGGKTLANITDGTSKCRNETLMKLMSMIPLPDGQGITAEGQGSGILYMINEMQSRTLQSPHFKADIDSFTVTLGRGGSEIAENREWIDEISKSQLNSREESALIIVRRLENATAGDLRRELRIDSDDARLILEELTTKGLLEQGTHGSYRIADTNKTIPTSATTSEAILSALSQNDPRSMREIEKATGKKIATLRAAMAKLVKNGLVVAIGNPNDINRKYLLANSEKQEH